MKWHGQSLSDSYRLSDPDCGNARRPRSAEKAEEAVKPVKKEHAQSLKVAARTLGLPGGWFNLRLGPSLIAPSVGLVAQ
jgi:hypothetical protein